VSDLGRQVAVGDRVWLLLRPARHRPEQRHDGTVIGVDDGPRPGVRIALDQPALTPDCYATHAEVHRVEETEP
jgi:hypothetical protein